MNNELTNERSDVTIVAGKNHEWLLQMNQLSRLIVTIVFN